LYKEENMAYSKDLRERVIQFVQEGGSRIEASRRFKVSRMTVFGWLKPPQQTEPKKTGPKGSWKLNLDHLKELVAQHPDLYQRELGAQLGVSGVCVWAGLKKLNLSRKKNATLLRKKRQVSQVVSRQD
jgi:putative transposase